MASRQHIGKVLVHIRPEEDRKVVLPVPWLMQAYPRYFCNPIYTYVIAGTEFIISRHDSKTLQINFYIEISTSKILKVQRLAFIIEMAMKFLSGPKEV